MLSTTAAVVCVMLGQVILRGGGRAVDAPIIEVSARGVEVGGDEPRVIGWDAVREVLGSPHAEQAAPFAEISEAVWRARLRLARGDVALAAPMFDELFKTYRALDGPTALLVAEGTLRCRLDRRDAAGAVEPWLVALRCRRAGWKIAGDPPLKPLLDDETGLVPDLPPVLTNGLDALPHEWSDPLARALARLYAGEQLSETSADSAVLLVSDVTGALRAGSAPDAAAHERLRVVIDQHPGAWREAWARAALGASGLTSDSPAERTVGVLELLSVVSRFDAELPMLSEWCRERAAMEIERGGDAAGAARVRSGAPAAVAASNDEALERFLQDHGLDRLLAEHLWRRFNATPRQEQLELAKRLAALYSRMIVSASDPAAQLAIEESVDRLLAAAPEADTIELRLNLVRAAFGRVEPVLDRWRLRLGDETAARDAIARVGVLARDFADIAGRAQQRVLALERQEEAMRASDDRVLVDALAAARRHRSLARFHAGWASTLGAEFDPQHRDALAAEALKHFGWLLNAAPGEAAKPEAAAAQLFRFEHVARSAVGAAVAEALRGGTDAGMRWLDLLENTEGVAAEISEQVFIRRIQVLGMTGRWELLQNWVNARRAADSAEDRTPRLSTAEARLIAVLAMESRPSAESDRAAARRLASTATEHLLLNAEWGHARDLAERYPELTRGDSFTALMTRGLQAIEHARSALPSTMSDAKPPAEIAGMLTRAAQEFETATHAAPGDAHRGAAMLMHAAALFESRADAATLLRASERFESAASNIADKPRAADALWMAIRAAEAAALEPRASPDLTARRDRLLAAFVGAHPLDARAAEVSLRRALATQGPSEAMARELLSIPESSPAYLPARREAARVLYENFRTAPESERAFAARRFVAVAEPLLAADARQAQPPISDPAAAERAGAFARRIADALLAASPPDIAGAVRALDLVAQLAAAGRIADPEAAAEIEFRRLQIALIRNDGALAESLIGSIRARSPRFGAMCEALLFHEAAERWDTARDAPDEKSRDDAAQRLVSAGRKLLSLEDTPAAAYLASPDWTIIRVTIAHAAAELWRTRRDTDQRDLALLLYRIAARERPNDAGIIRGSAEIDEAAGEWASAAEKWSVLLGAMDAGTDPWHECKLRLLGALAVTDPPRAKELLRQHRLLYPDDGPPAWRPRYAAIAQRLRDLGEGTP